MQDVIDFNLLKEYDTYLKEVLCVWLKNTAYAVNDVVQYRGKWLKCITAGTSGTTTLDFTNLDIGDTITDGTVVWEIFSPYSSSSTGKYNYIVRLRADSSGIYDLAGNTWTNNNVLSTANGKFGGNALTFSSANDSYLAMPNNLIFKLYEDFTISFWALVVSDSNSACVFTLDAVSICASYGASHEIVAYLANVDDVDDYYRYASGSLSSGWHHYAVTRSDGVTRFFIDGSMVYSDLAKFSIGHSSNQLFIGSINGSTGRSFDGYLDDVCVIKGRALWTSDFNPPTNYLPDN